MKKTILSIVMVFYFSYTFCQKDWDPENFARIEIEQGTCHSIRFLKEGLLCTSCDINYNKKFDFFPLANLKLNDIMKLQKYISTHDVLYKDTVINDPTTIISADGYSYLKINVIKSNSMYVICWVDGKCKYLEDLLSMINNLIPEDKRRVYEIRFQH